MDLRERLASEWQIAEIRTEQSQLAVASITANITLFEHRETAAAVDAQTASAIPTRSLFAIAIRFQPSLSTLGFSPRAVLSFAAPRAKQLVLESAEADGLIVEDQLTKGEFERADGTTGRHYAFSTALAIDSDGTDRRTIDAETHVAVWPTETSYGMAGGTLPLTVPQSVSDAVAIEPDRDRGLIQEFVRTIETDSGTNS
ncbi:hypothetical protein OB905_10275 [Halobacteria archaeon AArc-dxtr1]|nr:hypothetical protein [Halobacteria archaeon AArc-dxtr1]